jgi:hypothetical protein
MWVLPYKPYIESHKDKNYTQIRDWIPVYLVEDSVFKSIIVQIAKQVVKSGYRYWWDFYEVEKPGERVAGRRDTPEVVDPSGPEDQPVATSHVSN